MTRSRKAIVLFSFCLRLPHVALLSFPLTALLTEGSSLIGVAVVRLVYIARTVSSRPKYVTFAATNPEILTQLEMHLNVITATLPCLHAFLRSLDTGNLGGVSTSDLYYSHNVSGTHNQGSTPGTQDDGALRVNVNKTFELQHMERSATNSALGRVRGDDAASDNSENALYGLDDRIQRA
jgi:hypothetical protein